MEALLGVKATGRKQELFVGSDISINTESYSLVSVFRT